jgi:acetyl esterase/lipase
MIADAGFTVVGLRYSLAPEATYPTPIRQVMTALAHLQNSADRLHVDPTRLVLAGDSAGAQISAQVAAMITNPDYARQVGVASTVDPAQLRGVALCCGIFDLAAINPSSSFKNFFKAVGWAYSGTRDYQHNQPFVATVSVTNHLTADFPPTFLTAGNADPLAPQSAALAALLTAKGVEVDTLFYPPDHQPPLGHEYQFDLDLEDGRIALQRLLAFFSHRNGPDTMSAPPTSG